MPSVQKNIRLNANAAIVRDGKILLIEFHDENGLHYNLPGGGVENGESVIEALQRECFEEACVQVKAERFLLVWEYVPEKEDYRYGPKQKVGMVFLCHLPGQQEAQLPKSPDKNQVGVKWFPLDELGKFSDPGHPPLYPMIGESLLTAIRSGQSYPLVWRDLSSRT